jgi:putative NADH-flavin reductase
MTAAAHGRDTTMRLAILGATGGIGGHLLSWAADAGYPAHVLARDPAAVPRRPGITVTRGDATDPDAVADTVASADAVLTALGPRGAKTPMLLTTAAGHVVATMQKTGARRLITVSAAGAFVQEDPGAGGLVKLILPRIFAKPYADVRAMEQVIRDCDLDWTLVRPTRLVNDPGRGSYRVRDQYPPPGLSKIARADVAHFIIGALTEGSYIHQSPAICW